jgi:predicted MPP superfamily phosphohydrolase
VPTIRARIVQISDLHVNRKVRPGITDMLKQIVRRIGPDILIVSGDLANQPVPWQMKKAAKLLREIEAECAIDRPIFRTIVIPGNHDFKYWGNVGLRRLTRVPFEIYFRRSGLARGFWWRCREAFKLSFQAL